MPVINRIASNSFFTNQDSRLMKLSPSTFSAAFYGLVFLLFILKASDSNAQDRWGEVKGLVTNNNGDPIAGVSVMAEMVLLRKELNGIGNNFNQAVKKLHTLQQIAEFKSWIITYELEKKILFNKIDEIKNRINKIADKWLQQFMQVAVFEML